MKVPARDVIRIAAETWVPYIEVIIREDGSYEVDGPIGNLLKIIAEEVELAVGPFTITPERETACDFSASVHTDDLAIMMTRPGLTNDISAFLRPFSLLVWLLFLCSAVSIGVALAGSLWAEGKMFTFPTILLIDKTPLFVLQTLTQDSPKWLPMKDGGRLVAATWLLASFVFASSYSGILTAMLAVPKVTIPIDSVADLVSQTKMPWRLEAGSMKPQFFMESEDPVRRKVATDMSGTIPDCWSARQDIADGKYAAICDETSMKKSMSWDFSVTGKCHLYIASHKVYSNAMKAMAFKVNSTYRKQADQVIMMVKESGLLARWMGLEITNTSQCLRPPSSDKREGIAALSLEAILGPFLVLASGNFWMLMIMKKWKFS
ncbi:glutamate receptor 2-like [Cherax quadricarinatus]|uniref:glutamate receptor 2-like n=1 Tax=Cherax quadricarinatus TaxID=27406 RepID=UPI00387E3E4B